MTAAHEQFTVEGAARVLGIDYDAVIDLVQTGQLSGKRERSGGWMIKSQSVMEYLQKGAEHGSK